MVAQLMGDMSYQKAAKKWGMSHMTLYNIVNPEPGKAGRPPRQEDLLKIAGDDLATYRRLALAAYGLLTDDHASVSKVSVRRLEVAKA
jgi:hypothetical protein